VGEEAEREKEMAKSAMAGSFVRAWEKTKIDRERARER